MAVFCGNGSGALVWNTEGLTDTGWRLGGGSWCSRRSPLSPLARSLRSPRNPRPTLPLSKPSRHSLHTENCNRIIYIVYPAKEGRKGTHQRRRKSSRGLYLKILQGVLEAVLEGRRPETVCFFAFREPDWLDAAELYPLLSHV